MPTTTFNLTSKRVITSFVTGGSSVTEYTDLSTIPYVGTDYYSNTQRTLFGFDLPGDLIFGTINSATLSIGYPFANAVDSYGDYGRSVIGMPANNAAFASQDILGATLGSNVRYIADSEYAASGYGQSYDHTIPTYLGTTLTGTALLNINVLAMLTQAQAAGRLASGTAQFIWRMADRLWNYGYPYWQQGDSAANTTMTIDYTPAPLWISGAGPIRVGQSRTLTLNRTGTSGSLTATLSQSAGSVLSIPATVTIADSASSQTFSVSGTAAGSSTITATNTTTTTLLSQNFDAVTVNNYAAAVAAFSPYTFSHSVADNRGARTSTTFAFSGTRSLELMHNFYDAACTATISGLSLSSSATLTFRHRNGSALLGGPLTFQSFNGTSWSTIGTLPAASVTNSWNLFSITIPAGSQQVRWVSTPTGNTDGWDNYVIDDFQITTSSSVSATSSIDVVDLTTNLVSYWKLDESSGNAVDSWGANNLTAVSAPGATTGKVNGARTFNGSSSYFSAASNSSLQIGDIDFTFSGWFYQTADGANRRLINKINGAVTTLEYQIFSRNDLSNTRRIYFELFSGSALVGQVASDTLALNQWYFFCAWHDADADQIVLQINDTTYTAATSGAPVASSAPFAIGSLDTLAGTRWQGNIDEVGFWKRKLTTTERAYLFNGGAGNIITDLTPPASGMARPEINAGLINYGRINLGLIR